MLTGGFAPKAPGVIGQILNNANRIAATATQPGLVTTGTQTFGGAKTFAGASVTVNNALYAGSAHITGDLSAAGLIQTDQADGWVGIGSGTPLTYLSVASPSLDGQIPDTLILFNQGGPQASDDNSIYTGCGLAFQCNNSVGTSQIAARIQGVFQDEWFGNGPAGFLNFQVWNEAYAQFFTTLQIQSNNLSSSTTEFGNPFVINTAANSSQAYPNAIGFQSGLDPIDGSSRVFGIASCTATDGGSGNPWYFTTTNAYPTALLFDQSSGLIKFYISPTFWTDPPYTGTVGDFVNALEIGESSMGVNVPLNANSALVAFNTLTSYGVATFSGGVTANSNFTFASGINIVCNATTGTKIGTGNTQKIGFWNATPIAQPTTSVAAATFVANSGTTINDASTFDGYTLKQLVKALRNEGLLA